MTVTEFVLFDLSMQNTFSIAKSLDILIENGILGALESLNNKLQVFIHKTVYYVYQYLNLFLNKFSNQFISFFDKLYTDKQ